MRMQVCVRGPCHGAVIQGPANREFGRLARDSVPTLILAWEYANPQDVKSPQSSVRAPHKPDSALTFHSQAGRERRAIGRSLLHDGFPARRQPKVTATRTLTRASCRVRGEPSSPLRFAATWGFSAKFIQGLPIRLHVRSVRGFTRPMSSYTCFVSKNSSIASAPCRRP